MNNWIMRLNKEDLHKCGIYCIRNIVNDKVYIGKSKNIYARIQAHIYLLRIKSKDENRHLIGAWHKYGEDKFEYTVIEYLELDETLLRDRETYWITTYDSTNRDKGYNMRVDSSTGCIVQEETRQLLSENNKGEKNPNYGNRWNVEQREHLSKIMKERYANGETTLTKENTAKGLANRLQKWAEHPELKDAMREKVSKKITKHRIYQYNKNHELIKVWDKVYDILAENPTYKRHNIYAACSGEKPTIYGYIWEKVLIDDIVQPESEGSE